MSIMEIDAATYYRLGTEAMARYMRRGYSPAEALRLAEEIMAECFIINTVAAAHEDDLDSKENGIYD